MEKPPTDPENINLFSVIQRGDRRIRSAHKKAIILVGLTRIGKSTTFNWILNKPMRGKGKLMSHYINQVEGDETAAKVGNSYASVTLAPNVHLEYEKDLSLIDMAGYEDTRNFIGVIGVSYFLKALFEQVREAKFVIVFDQNKFTQENGSGLIRTFNGFINMFHYKDMPTQVKIKLKSSISVVITKSRNAHEHFEYLDEVVEQLRNENLMAENRETVIQLIEYVRNAARIHPFMAARDNGNPEECNFVQNFSQNRGWNYFNIDEAESIMGKSPIALPFDRDFKKLSQQQKAAFTTAIEARVQSYLSFSKILEKITQNFSNNWNEFLEVWKNEGKSVPNHFKLKDTFEKMKQFIQNNDVYNSKSTVENKFRVSYEPMSLIKSIKQILKIYERVEKIGAPEGGDDFTQAMNLFTTQFSTLVQCFRGFASDNEEEELIERLKYILIRGFRQFNKLFQLKEDCIIDAKQKLRDNCNLAFSIDKQTFIEKFVTKFTSDLLAKIFPTLELLAQYEQFFGQYEQKYSSVQDPIFFNQQRCNIQMAKADLLVGAGQKNKALHCYIRALRNLSQISSSVNLSDNFNTENEKNEELNNISMKKLKLIRKIVFILKGLTDSQEFNYKKYALWLCLHHKMIDDACQIYQLIIDSPLTALPQKLRIYDDYATYCTKWGKIQRGIELLQKKMALEQDSFEDYSSTVAAMKHIVSKREELIKGFNTVLNDIKRLPEVDNELNQQLKEIEYLVPQ